MTYDILKRLKDSGFPMEPVAVAAGAETVLLRPAVVFSTPVMGKDRSIFYVPSLADLVVACGNGLQNMSRVNDGWECSHAPDAGHGDGTNVQTHGATLDDALAELWLIHRATRSANE